MVNIVIAWLAFPAVLGLVTLGLGLLVERAGGRELPGVLVLPVGLAALIALSQVTTYWASTAPFSTPVVVAGAAAGLLLGARRLRGLPARIDRWAALAAAAVFAVFAAFRLAFRDETV